MFDRRQLESALTALGELAHAEGQTVEIAIYGESALMLTFDWRKATRDVDAVFETDREIIRRLSAVVAERMGLVPDWINDEEGLSERSRHERGFKAASWILSLRSGARASGHGCLTRISVRNEVQGDEGRRYRRQL